MAPIGGLALFLACVLGYAFFLGSQCKNSLSYITGPLIFRMIPSLPFFALGIIGTSAFAFGFSATFSTLSSARFLFSTPQAHLSSETPIAVLRFMIVSAYAQGGLLFLISLLNILPSIAGAIYLGNCIWLSISTLMIPILISEIVLRPLKAKLETIGAGKPVGE
ncbi:MAG: hypothetical protein ACKOLA_14760 [Spartobacteria bacterium]